MLPPRRPDRRPTSPAVTDTNDQVQPGRTGRSGRSGHRELHQRARPAHHARMIKRATIGVVLAVLCCIPAQAACPPAAPGNTAEAILANGQRLICLQNEVAAATRQRQYELQLQQLTRSVQNLEFQHRLDVLADVPVYVPPPLPSP